MIRVGRRAGAPPDADGMKLVGAVVFGANDQALSRVSAIKQRSVYETGRSPERYPRISLAKGNRPNEVICVACELESQ
jgi:hypothetical protein